MKINGPKGPGPTPPTSKPARKSGGSAVEGPGFSNVLKEGVASAKAPESTDLVAEVTAKLKAGDVTNEQALEMLIEAVVRQQVGEVAPALGERLRAVVRETITADPVFAEKVRRLTDGDET